MPLALMNYPGIAFQERDFALLRGLFESRLMTGEHICKLYFSGRREAAKKRVQKLKAVLLVRELPRKVYEPALLTLTKRGFSLLREEGQLMNYPTFSVQAFEKRNRVSVATVRHELAVTDLKASISLAVAKTKQLKVVEFSTWGLLHEFEARPHGVTPSIGTVILRPDAFFRIHERDDGGAIFEHSFFAEIDRSTEQLETLATKAACYVDYYRSGSFAERSGGSRSDVREFPFRALFVLRSAERRNNIADVLISGSSPILSQVWLTTHSELLTNPLGPIWIRPGDYRKAGFDFRLDRQNRQRRYLRDAARDRLIDSKVPRVRLFGESTLSANEAPHESTAAVP